MRQPFTYPAKSLYIQQRGYALRHFDKIAPGATERVALRLALDRLESAGASYADCLAFIGNASAKGLLDGQWPTEAQHRVPLRRAAT